MKRIFTGLLLLFFVPIFGIAAELPDNARSEIERLLTALGSSSCEFYRNGSWYTATEAEAHLRKKYQYLLNKELIGSAEDFIAKGATQSSISGEEYQVRCKKVDVQPSGVWLGNKLKTLR